MLRLETVEDDVKDKEEGEGSSGCPCVSARRRSGTAALGGGIRNAIKKIMGKNALGASRDRFSSSVLGSNPGDPNLCRPEFFPPRPRTGLERME